MFFLKKWRKAGGRQIQEELKFKMSVSTREMRSSWGDTHMFNEELGQPVLLLYTFFQFSQEKTKRREEKTS